MTTETILTDEQIDAVPYIGKLSERGLREFARTIEQAVLQSPEIQKLKQDSEMLNWLEKEVQKHNYEKTLHVLKDLLSVLHQYDDGTYYVEDDGGEFVERAWNLILDINHHLGGFNE